MKPEWTGDIVKWLHIHDISQKELARALYMDYGHLRQILTGMRPEPKGGREQMFKAIEKIVADRKEGK